MGGGMSEGEATQPLWVNFLQCVRARNRAPDAFIDAVHPRLDGAVVEAEDELTRQLHLATNARDDPNEVR